MNHSIEKTDDHGRGIAVEFSQRDDHFVHQVVLIDNQLRTPILESIESKSEWPSSPPLQQVSIEQQESGSVAMALGMAGDGHWSAVFRFEEVAPCLLAEIACKTPSASPELSSAYRLLHGNVASIAGNELVIDCDRTALRIVSDAEESELEVTYVDNSIELGIRPSGVVPSNQTWQWTYRVELMTLN